jgi:type IV secretion system protein TrbL
MLTIIKELDIDRDPSILFMPKNNKCLLYAIMAACCLFFTSSVYADTSAINANNTLDSIVDLFKNRSQLWESTLRVYATTLFWILAFIEFTWMGMKLALKRADLSEWLSEIVNQILFIGFFLMLLTNSSSLAHSIIQSFMTAASTASHSSGGVEGVTPSNVFDVGLNLYNKVAQSTKILHPMDNAALMLTADAIVICFAYIAACMVEAMVEAYLVVSAGVLFMGFGGSRWTKDYALNFFKYAVSVGAKLFVLQLLVGLGENMIIGFVNDFQSKGIDIAIILGAAVVMAFLTKNIPGHVQGLISGVSVSNGTALMGAAATFAAAAKVAASSVSGAGMAAIAAKTLASANAEKAQETGTKSAGGFWGNLGKAAMEDLGGRLSGRSRQGTSGGRMADNMFRSARDIRSELNKPNLNNSINSGSGKSSHSQSSSSNSANVASDKGTENSIHAETSQFSREEHKPEHSNGTADSREKDNNDKELPLSDQIRDRVIDKAIEMAVEEAVDHVGIINK